MHRLEKLCFAPLSNKFTSRVVRKFGQVIINTSDLNFYVVEVCFNVFSVKIWLWKIYSSRKELFELTAFWFAFGKALTEGLIRSWQQNVNNSTFVSWQHFWKRNVCKFESIWKAFLLARGNHQILTVSTQNHATSTRMVSCLSFSTCVAKSALMIISLYNRRLKQFMFSLKFQLQIRNWNFRYELDLMS